MSLIREIRMNGGVEGQISYRKWLTYKMSAFEFYMSSVLFLIVAALTYSLFFLGGAIMCLGTGLKHTSWLKRQNQASHSQ